MLLGELLIREGALDHAGLDEALAAQVIHGGRIGTNLVEIGRVTEERLARALGQQHGVQAAFGTITPSPEALALLDKNYADDKDVLPLRVEGNRLFLLVINPDDIEARDHVAQVTGKRVVPVVVPEFRMGQLQRKHCAAFRPVRAVDMDAIRRPKRASEGQASEPAHDLMSEDDFATLYAAALTGGAGPTQDEEGLEEAEIVGEALAEIELGAGAIVTDGPSTGGQRVGDRRRAPAQTQVPVPVPPVAVAERRRGADRRGKSLLGSMNGVRPLTFAEAQQALASIVERDDIARTVLRFAVGKFTRVLLLSVQKDLALGWHGAGAIAADAQTLAISLRGPSPFRLVRDSRSHFLGPLRQDATTVAFLGALGGGEPRSAVILPILAGGRVVNILYGDNGPERFATPDIGELLILSQRVGRSYEEMIDARRARGASPRKGR